MTSTETVCWPDLPDDMRADVLRSVKCLIEDIDMRADAYREVQSEHPAGHRRHEVYDRHACQTESLAAGVRALVAYAKAVDE